MKLGVTTFVTDQSMDIVALARAAEERGFHSLYVPEHTHIPTSRRTPSPTGDAVLAEEYKRTLDPFVALAAAAAVTTRLEIGTGVCLVAQRDPIVLAKEVATLDLISNGRFMFGIGFGWNREEMQSHGVTFRERRALVREKVLAMQRLWHEDEASFAGDHVRLQESWAWPKPTRTPWPPVLIGGAPGPKLFEHIAEYGDAWIPIGGAGVVKALPALREAVTKAGRDPSQVEVIPFGSIPDERKLEYYASLGVREVVARLPSAPEAEVLAVLDRYAKLV